MKRVHTLAALALLAACGAAVSFGGWGRPLFALGAAAIAALSLVLRRKVLAVMQALAAQMNAFVYVYEGDVQIGAEAPRALPRRSAGVLSRGDGVRIVAAGEGARFILLAALPLNEPVAQYGPFVMNTAAELEQAVRDYQTGRLTAA